MSHEKLKFNYFQKKKTFLNKLKREGVLNRDNKFDLLYILYTLKLT